MPFRTITRPLLFITTTVVDWVDVFTRPIYNHIVIESLQHCKRDKSLQIYAWVLMSNHLHLVVSLDKGIPFDQEILELSNVIRDFKKFTSKKTINNIASNSEESRADWMLNRFQYAAANGQMIKEHRFWQEGYYRKEIYTPEFLRQKIEYIHRNPVRREIVNSPEHYRYSSEIDYAGGKGLLDVIVVL